MPRTKLIAVDWSNKDENLAVFDGKKILDNLPAPSSNLIIAVENIPLKYARPYFDVGTKIFRCDTNIVSAERKRTGEAKSHETDARVIYRLFKDTPDVFREWSFDPFDAELRDLWAAYKQIQGERNATGNRMYAGSHATIRSYFDMMKKHEAMLKTDMLNIIRTMPIYTEFLEKVDGVGVAIAAGLLAYVGDINRFPTLQKAQAYFGLHVVDGKAPRRTPGQVANWSQEGRSILLGNLASGLVQHGDEEYQEVYRKEKERQLEICFKEFGGTKTSTGKEYPWKGHAERRARRKVVKKFFRRFYYAYKRLGAGDKIIPKDETGKILSPTQVKRLAKAAEPKKPRVRKVKELIAA